MATSTVPRTGPAAPAAGASRPADDLGVRVLGPADEEAAVALLARGFAAEPGNLALYPDLAVRETMLQSGARVFVRSVTPLGCAHGVEVDGTLAAIALWHPPGVPATTVRDLLATVRVKASEAPTIARAIPGVARRTLADPFASLRLVRLRARGIRIASEGPTWHLAFLATDPEHRGHGLARRLLDRQLARCDADGLPVWLETTDPVNPPIYERFGFRTVANVEDAVWLPGWWAMRRDPRP
jgi:GNAT superfamily N-acetyltransferase